MDVDGTFDADSKLVITWLVGDRSGNTAEFFLRDLASRLAKRVQLTTDPAPSLRGGQRSAFGGDVDYAQIRKIYGQEHGDTRRYSPPVLAWDAPARPDRKPQEEAHLDVLRRATEPNDPDGHAALHAADQWLLQETLNLCAAVAIHFTFYNPSADPHPTPRRENAREVSVRTRRPQVEHPR